MVEDVLENPRSDLATDRSRLQRFMMTPIYVADGSLAGEKEKRERPTTERRSSTQIRKRRILRETTSSGSKP